MPAAHSVYPAATDDICFAYDIRFAYEENGYIIFAAGCRAADRFIGRQEINPCPATVPQIGYVGQGSEAARA